MSTGDFFIYVLKLEHECYYVGMTNNLKKRLGQHRFEPKGFTKHHRVVSSNPFYKVFKTKDKSEELFVTIEMMALKGFEKVRGSTFTRTELSFQDKRVLAHLVTLDVRNTRLSASLY